jgi:HEPN domain-containing protein
MGPERGVVSCQRRLSVPNRARDWMSQAVRDLEQAQDSRHAGRHEWACFAAQQAAEKAVKALHLHLGQEAWGHVVARLLAELPSTVALPKGLIDKGRVLDTFYIPPRYPNSHPEGAPFEHYGPLQSDEAISYAREILEFSRSQMA